MGATDMSEPSSLMLIELVDRWGQHLRHERRYAENTCSGYLSDIRLSLSEMGDALGRPVELLDLTQARIQEHLSALRFKPATILRRAASVRAFFRWAAGILKLCSDAAEGLSLPRIPRRKLPRSLSTEEADRLCRAPLTWTRPGWIGVHELRDSAFLWILRAGGLRISEACGLDMRNVEVRRSGDVILRFSGKGGHERIVPIAAGEGASAITRYLARRHELGGQQQALFLSVHRERYTRWGGYDLVARWAARAGVEASPHTLRHTFGREMVAACGEGLRGAQELMGHADPKTTAGYSMIDVDRLLAVARRHPAARPSGAQLIERGAQLVQDCAVWVWGQFKSRISGQARAP